jgi:cytoskeletal protein RodZ
LPIPQASALPHGAPSKSTPNRWVFIAFAVAALGILWLALHFLGARRGAESSEQPLRSAAPEIAASTPLPIVASPTPAVASEKSESPASQPPASFDVAEPTGGASLSFSPPQPAGSETPVTADLLIENWNQPTNPVVHWSCRIKDHVFNGASNLEQVGKNVFRIAFDLPSEARNEETCTVEFSLQGWMPLKCVFKRDTDGNFASEGRQTIRRQAGGSSVSPAYMPPPK